jgi:predicted DNA-binding transcriptional regulator AlpA
MEDERLIAQFLGSAFSGRRYLRYAELEALGIVDNRATLALWIRKRVFPAPLKIAGRTGKTLVWLAPEIARHVAQRASERDDLKEMAAIASPMTAEDQDQQQCPLTTIQQPGATLR